MRRGHRRCGRKVRGFPPRVRLGRWLGGRGRDRSPPVPPRSVLEITTARAPWKIGGYFSGLFSPSVAANRTMRCASPRSKDAGQTRLPTFSMKSNRTPSLGSASTAAATIRASRWQTVPVVIWTTGAPLGRSASASAWVSRSPTTTAQPTRACKRSKVACNSVVFPEPGDDTRLSARMPRARKNPRLRSASRWFASRTCCAPWPPWRCQLTLPSAAV